MSDKEKFNKKEYDIKYQRDNIKRIVLGYQKADYEKIVAAAEKAGEKPASFCKKAIEQRINSEE